MWATLLAVQTPECAWCRVASTRHPDVGLKVTSYYARPGGNATEEVEMTGPAWKAVVEDIRGLASVGGVEVLDEGPHGARVRIAATECALPAAIEASGVVPQLPFDVALGCDKWLLLTSQEHAREFFEHLRASSVDTEILYAGEYAPEAVLTPRQQEILDTAIRAGYYEYPRRITLTHLAEKIGIAKSTLSQALMLVESEIITRARTSPSAKLSR